MMYYFAWNPLHWVLLPVDQIHCFPYRLSELQCMQPSVWWPLVTTDSFLLFLLRMQCLAFLVFYGILNVALVLAANSPDPRVYSSPADYVRGVCEAVALLNTLWCLLAEVIQMYK